MLCSEALNELSLFSLSKRIVELDVCRTRRDLRRWRVVLIMVCKNLHRDNIPKPKGLFKIVQKTKTRTIGWKLKPDKFKLEIKQMFNKWGHLTIGTNYQGNW